MSNILMTDAYKFSMAEAGWPLRREVFYYSHRKGGPHYLPFDVTSMIKAMLPKVDGIDTRKEDLDFLVANGHIFGGAFWAAVGGALAIKGLPAGSWFFDREPAFTIHGPSAPVSWLEPLVLQLHYRIQVATTAKLEPEQLPKMVGSVTCEEQKLIVEETLDAVGVKAPPIEVRGDEYFRHVYERAMGLVETVGDPSRIFEVGMRAATCLEHHRLALLACKEAGISATSNVYLARLLDMKPVGTMGHEHVQRYGSDEDAFNAMVWRFPGKASFLLDTFDTIRSGLPAAFAIMEGTLGREDSVRFDSGDIESQYLVACSMARQRGLDPRFILEDGFTRARTARFEKLREFTGVKPENQLYGFGGYLVNDGDLTRDRVAAVYKLSQTGSTAVMKFGDEPNGGKESIPGVPVVRRRFLHGAWHGVIAQYGEELPFGDVELSGLAEVPLNLHFRICEVREFAKNPLQYSPETQALRLDLLRRRGGK